MPPMTQAMTDKYVPIDTNTYESLPQELAMLRQQVAEQSCYMDKFDSFFTTKPIGKGTGLGMPIGHQIVTKKQNASLECISSPGEGATFVIQIPITKVTS